MLLFNTTNYKIHQSAAKRENSPRSPHRRRPPRKARTTPRCRSAPPSPPCSTPAPTTSSSVTTQTACASRRRPPAGRSWRHWPFSPHRHLVVPSARRRSRRRGSSRRTRTGWATIGRGCGSLGRDWLLESSEAACWLGGFCVRAAWKEKILFDCLISFNSLF